MEIERIYTGNASDYLELLGKDMTEDMMRIYHRGIGIKDDEGKAVSAIIWETRHANDEEAVTEAGILKLAGSAEQAGSLLSRFDELVREEGIRRTVFELPFDEANEYEPMLMEHGFRTEKRSGRQLRLTVGELAETDISGQYPAEHIHAIKGINARYLKKGILRCMQRESRVINEDLDVLPVGWYEQEVSCYAEKDGYITGLLLAHMTHESGLRTEYLSGVCDDPPQETYGLIKRAIATAVKKYSKDTCVVINRPDKTAETFTDRLFNDRKGEEILSGNRREMLKR